MSFLHSWMILWFLPLAAIPIILHLLTLFRLKTVELPTFRFLFDSYVQQRRRMQFLEALLAILRVLFIVFLVFVFSRPVIDNWGGLFARSGSGGQEVILLIDCSASMNARTGGTSAMDRARSMALQLVKELRPEDRLTLVRVGARPEELLSRYSTDTRGIEERIENLQPSSARANLFAALLQLFGPEASQRNNPAVYLITDCQSNSWKEARNQGLDKVLPADLAFTVINVGSQDPLPNRAVVGDAPRRNRAVAGLPFVLQPRVVNFSKTEPAELTLSVFIDEKEVARTTLALEPGETATRSILYTPTEPGIRRGRFEITGKTPDRFPDDDRFFFTLAVEPRVRVVLVNGQANPDPQLDEARYLLTALTSRAETAPADKKPDTGPTTKEILRSLDVREVPEVGLTPEVLAEASVIVLANCGGLEDDQFNRLRNFVRAGGGLLVFPGDKVVNLDRYNKSFFTISEAQKTYLTAARLQPAQGDPEKAETFEQLAALDFSHPALTVFDNPDPDARHFKTVRIYKRFGIQVPEAKSDTWPLARFRSGAPALIESRYGDGIVILSAFPAHPRWSNLPLKPDFVPLMLRLVSYAQHRPEAEAPPVVVAESTAEVAVSNSWAPAEVVVTDPAGRPHTVALERSGVRLLGACEQTTQRGYYTVEVRSQRNDVKKAASLAFAVNLAPEESDFTLLDEAEVRAILPKEIKFTWFDATAETQARLGRLGRKTEVWTWLIWAVFLLIGVEFLLSTLGGSRRRGEEGPGLGERVMEVSTGAWVGKMTGAPGGET
jgi:hypothetical protein